MSLLELGALSSKYLLRYRRRYLFLFSALAFGFCIVTAITAIKEGISENLYFAAQNHYAGDIVFLGHEENEFVWAYNRHLDTKTIAAVFEAVEEAKLLVIRYTERTLFNDGTSLFFNGESIDLRYLNGVDWDNEKVYFDKLSYVSGGNSSLDDESIIISEQTASVLGIKCGDSLILELTNRSGQKNTAEFIVGAIVADKTVFGFYKAFIARSVMNGIIGFEKDDCSSVGFFVRDRGGIEKDIAALQKIVSSKVLAASVMKSGAEYKTELGTQWSGIKLFILTIPVYLAELYQLIEALDILNYFLYIMMLIIILVSSSVTYRLILHERIKEIGTMRAIGFNESDIRLILIIEVLFLGTISVIAGFCLALLLCKALSYLSFDWFPGFDMFLSNGALTAVFNPLAILINIMAVYIVLFIAVSIPAYRSSRAPLPEMLSGSMKG